MTADTPRSAPPDFRSLQDLGSLPACRSAQSWQTLLSLSVSAACVLAVVVAFAPLRADEIGKDGLFITVPNPITENAVLQIEQRVKDAVERQGRSLRVVVFDFSPNGKPSGTANVFPCMHLKDYISRLRLGQIAKCPNVLTVAYLQDEVTDHTVLPVLACREIVMSSKAKLGHVLRSQDKPLGKEAKQAYDEVAKAWPIPELLPKLFEPSKNLSLLDEKQARKQGLCKGPPLETRQDVKEQYGLPALSLREDSLAGRTPVVWRIEVHGGLDAGRLNSLERRIKAAIRKKANVLILHLDCEGGETVDAAAMAEKLRKLKDHGDVLPVQTIAYMPPGRSLGAATFLAVGCSEIAMAPDARLGGFDYLKGTSAQELAVKQKMLVDLAKVQGYHSAFFQAMLEPAQSVYECRHRTRPGVAALATDADLRKEGNEWVPEKLVLAGDKGEFLSLDARTAQRYGIARYSDVTSVEQLYERYGFDPTKVETSRDDWLDALASFLREPLVNVLLIMVGVAGLILELKMPGFGVPGIIAAICFVLFFWAHAFAGQSPWEFTLLAVLLFVLGLVLLAIEILLLPGFGVTGISGVLLIIISLVLVMLEQMPATSQEWSNLGAALTTVGVGLVGGLCAALVIARYLPNIPYASRLVLQPPVESDDHPEGERTQEGLQASALLGAIGVAATTLRPAGKAQFGDQFLDVIAEGDYVNSGSRVQVIEIEGHRIVVKEV
jgi:membrane-bound ClpP family serine protease